MSVLLEETSFSYIRPPAAPPADAASPLTGSAPGAKIGIIIETSKEKRQKKKKGKEKFGG